MINQLETQDFVVRYLQYLESNGRQPSTIRRYNYDIQDFFKWWASKNGRELTFDDWRLIAPEKYNEFFNELIKERNYAVRTYKRIATVLTRMCVFYESLGYIVKIPNIDLTRLQSKELRDEDFVRFKDIEKLKQVIPSTKGLTDIQIPSRPLLNNRNLSIVMLFVDYGITLQELVNISMKDVNFIQQTVRVSSIISVERKIKLEKEDGLLLYSYYKDIPEPVRPRQFSDDPLFLAYDFWRGTYHWVYEINQPKRLTEVSIQKMLRQETRRAELRKGITPQQLRNTAIIKSIYKGIDRETVQKKFGFRTVLSVDRYLEYYQNNKESNYLQMLP